MRKIIVLLFVVMWTIMTASIRQKELPTSSLKLGPEFRPKVMKSIDSLNNRLDVLNSVIDENI